MSISHNIALPSLLNNNLGERTLESDVFQSIVNEFKSILPEEITLLGDLQSDLPKIAKDSRSMLRLESLIQKLPSQLKILHGDARKLDPIADNSIQLVLTSPPYWNLKTYSTAEGQLGEVDDYSEFILQLNTVWTEVYRILEPGGRLICVVGDVCLSRKKNNGIHQVIPLHSTIQESCRNIGFTNLAPIIWYKIANAVFEAKGNNGGFLGKPYEPNAIIKNDIEYILMLRKPGGYRSVDLDHRLLSLISAENHQKWFQQIWDNIRGASTKDHPAPFPLELAERLIRMFSFVGDTVLDPFLGTGTTMIAASRWGRNAIGVEVSHDYFEDSIKRINSECQTMFSQISLEIIR